MFLRPPLLALRSSEEALNAPSRSFRRPAAWWRTLRRGSSGWLCAQSAAWHDTVRHAHAVIIRATEGLEGAHEVASGQC